MAGAEGFEPPQAVLETAGLPLNLRPCTGNLPSLTQPFRLFPKNGSKATNSVQQNDAVLKVRPFPALLHFAVQRMFPQLRIVFHQLQTLGGLFLVFGRRVQFQLRFRTLQRDDFAGHV